MHTIVISRASTDEERSRGIAFLAGRMKETYGSSPPPEKTPPDLFIATEGESVIGTLALQFGSRGPLGVTELYQFEESALPIKDFTCSATVQYSRWCSVRHGTGVLLWHAASVYAIREGALYSALICKDFMLDTFRRSFNCEWHIIKDAILRKEKVAPSDENFFFTGTPPLPGIGIIREQTNDLPRIVQDLSQGKDIRINV